MSPALQVADERKTNRNAGRTRVRPNVSVVLVSDGCWETVEMSLARVAPRCRFMHAEVIAMSCGDEAVPMSLQAAHPEVRFCCAPVGTSEAQLRTVAMLEASGDIVALRRAAEVTDALWLDAHFRAATGTEPSEFDAGERAVYDGVATPIVDGELSADLVTTPSSSWRDNAATRRVVETSPASGASSAA